MTKQDKKHLIHSIAWVSVAVILILTFVIYSIQQEKYSFIFLLVFVLILGLLRLLGSYLQLWKEWKEERKKINV